MTVDGIDALKPWRTGCDPVLQGRDQVEGRSVIEPETQMVLRGANLKVGPMRMLTHRRLRERSPPGNGVCAQKTVWGRCSVDPIAR
jgi:hypothetical protein